MSEFSAECHEANRIAAKLRGEGQPFKRSQPLLTDRQVQVLIFCRDFLSRNDEFPPMWAISKHFGWKSANAAQAHVDALARRGVVERNEIGNWRFSRAHTTTEPVQRYQA